jgi:predicted RecA/RadA family phage recombinase
MSKNKAFQEGATLQVTAPAALLSGAGVQIGQIFGVAETDAASGALVNIDTEGVFDLPKATGGSNAFAIGDRIFWDNTALLLTPSPSGNLEIGFATAPALVAATTARVKLGTIDSQNLKHIGFQAFANASVASQAFYVVPVAIRILGVSEVHSTLGTDAGAVTGDIVKLTGTQAIGAGVTVLAAAVSLKAANNTVQSPALSATLANLTLAPGDRLGFVLSGTATAVAGLVFTILAQVI